MYRGSERLATGDAAGSRELDEAIAILSASPRTDFAVRACVNAAGAAFRAGRFDVAERYVEHGLQIAKGTEFFSGEYRLSLTRAAVRVSRGRWREAEAELRALLTAGGEPGIMEPLARCLLARILGRQGQHDEARDQVIAAARTAGRTDEARLLGPIAIAEVETRWLAGDDADLADVAGRALALATATDNHTIAAELSRYLRWAGLDTVDVPSAPEPWASGLRGDWRTAASLWQRRGEPYEEGLELVSGGGTSASRAASSCSGRSGRKRPSRPSPGPVPIRGAARPGSDRGSGRRSPRRVAPPPSGGRRGAGRRAWRSPPARPRHPPPRPRRPPAAAGW